jgi:hypothetical protein
MDWTIPLDSGNPVIESKVDDIRFRFCLLNEQGKPANRFKEGEDFSFSFIMENKRKTGNLMVPEQTIEKMLVNGFCKVVTQKNEVVGYPFKVGGCKLGWEYYPFSGTDNKFELTVSWNDGLVGNCHFENLHQSPLPKGTYYTEFTHTFEFRIVPDAYEYLVDVPLSFKSIGPVTFKINFEIE